MKLDRERQGEMLALIGVVLWALFPIVTILTYSSALPAVVSLAWSTLFAGIFLGIVFALRRSWSEIRNKSALKDIALIALFNGVGYYTFFFIGLKYTSAGNASIMSLMEVFFSFLFFQVFKGQRMPRVYIFGSVLMLAGSIVLLLPNLQSLNKGDFFIFAATIFAPIGNFYQQAARKKVSSGTIIFVRSVMATPLIFFMAYLLGDKVSYVDFRQSFVFLLINGAVLLGLSKIIWTETIHRISVPKAISMSLSIMPFLTLFFAWLILKEVPTVWQLVSLAPLVAGVILITRRPQLVPMQDYA